MREFSFDAAKYLGAKKNAPDIYGRPARGVFYSPFSLTVLEMEKLMLVNIEGDPKYREIEIQSLGDDFGKGAVVVLYHKDGNVDVYYSKNSEFCEEMYAWGTNWHIIGETEIEPRFALTDRGVDACLKMTDRFGQVIEVSIKENHRNKPLANLLAPLGYDMQTDPVYFPFLYLVSCAPVNYDGTEIGIAVNGEERTPSKIPVPIQGERKYHSRFSMDPFIGLWNRRFQGVLEPLDPKQPTNGNAPSHGIMYTLAGTSGHHEIAQILSQSQNHKIYFRFSPPIPDLCCLKPGAKVKGKFSGGADDNDGVMGGSFAVRRDEDRIRLTLEPSKGWQPIPGKLWLEAYTWTANITVDNDGVAMDSSWTIARGGLHEFFKHH